MDYSKAVNSVAETIAKASKPLTEEQRLAMCGAVAVWLEKVRTEKVKLDITDEMVDRFLNFVERASYLHHPEVPYHGTVNGDSEEQWMRRYTKAVLAAAIAPSGI